MKSPPLEVWLTGSAGGGIESAAASLEPGGGALGRSSGTPDIGVLAETGVLSAAAPAIVAPLRKFRRDASGALSRVPPLDMVFLPERNRTLCRRTLVVDVKCRLAPGMRQDEDK
jgi:hypothetical protein